MAAWFGLCDDPHGIAGAWMGPQRATKEAAQRDVDSHKNKYPEHAPKNTTQLVLRSDSLGRFIPGRKWGCHTCAPAVAWKQKDWRIQTRLLRKEGFARVRSRSREDLWWAEAAGGGSGPLWPRSEEEAAAGPSPPSSRARGCSSRYRAARARNRGSRASSSGAPPPGPASRAPSGRCSSREPHRPPPRRP